MNLYHPVLFLHVSGDIGIFIGIGIQLVSLMALRRTTTIKPMRAIVERPIVAPSSPHSSPSQRACLWH